MRLDVQYYLNMLINLVKLPILRIVTIFVIVTLLPCSVGKHFIIMIEEKLYLYTK